MIVADASAGLAALLNAGPARELLGDEQVHVPHLIDVEIASSLRGNVARGTIDAAAGQACLDSWRRLEMIRYPIAGMLQRVWELRHDLTAYDAAYVALAELLGSTLVTADRRLVGSQAVRCPITVVPR